VSEEKTAPESQFDLILDRLRDELADAELQRDGGAGDDDGLTRRREAAERLWAVSAERPYLYRPGTWGRIRGAALVPLKAVLRRLMRWYVEPVAADQRRFNAAVLKLVDALAERADAGRSEVESRMDRLSDELQPRLESAQRLAVELDERLTRLERRQTAPAAPAAAQAVPAPEAPPLDYFAFESRMRGSTEFVRERQRVYVEEFRGVEPVLDVGCGRGEFLVLLREAGVEARGIDLDADMVAFCRGEGLDVEQADAVAYLEGLADDSLGGLFAAHVVEHLPVPALVRMLELAAAKLRAGGLLVAETPNPTTLIALATFYADLTHVRPLHPETLSFLVRHAGFREVEVRPLNEPPAEGRLERVRLPEELGADGANAALARNVERLNEVVFGPQDYAVVARA
jgi:O-antigen chain-terminating methyltransferase